MKFLTIVLVLALPLVATALEDPRGSLASDEVSAALTLKAYDAAYNLDYAEARSLLEQALAADSNDPDAHRAMAVVSWLRVGFLRGSVTVDDYLGNVTKPNINMTPPPPDEAQRFQRHITRALELSEAALRARPHDVEARFRVGSVVGIQASYGATIEGKVLASFKAARRAYDEHERVIEAAPSRKDAGLIVGTYRYIVSALSLPMRLLAYVAGFGGGRQEGLRMIEQAAQYAGQTQVEAKFALLLLYNREQRFADALRLIQELQQRYPRNRLLALEGGATFIRAGRFQEAEKILDDGINRLQSDRRERMFGELALWRYKRGVARARLKQTESATSDFQAALTGEARDWVRGRAHAELGRLAAQAGRKEQARQEYRLAIQLADRGNDVVGKNEAESLLRGLR